MKSKKKRVRMVLVLIFCLAAASLSAGGAQESENQQKKLVVWQFRGCNLENQIEAWGEMNGVEIELLITERDDMMNNLSTVLASGAGVPDVVTVGGPFIERFKQNPAHWVNILDYGASAVEGDYVQWRWNQMLDEEGTFMIGLPTDIGPMALGYRKDLFEAAGLPSDRDAVAAMMSTWDDFIETGKIIRAETGAAMVNNLGVVFEVLLGQDQRNFFDADGNLTVESSTKVKQAWDTVIKAYDANISNNIGMWSAEWGAGLQNGDFAVQLMPAWMMGAVKNNAPEAGGLWDITLLPESGGNWGGSMIGIPAKSNNKELAYELMSWVLSPEQQLQTFKVGGQFPSTPPVYDSPELVNYTDPYFSDAPVGKIYSEAAVRIEGAYLGPDYQTVISGLIAAIGRVEEGQSTPSASFKEAVADITRQLSR